jgi:hypothetical protein
MNPFSIILCGAPPLYELPADRCQIGGTSHPFAYLIMREPLDLPVPLTYMTFVAVFMVVGSDPSCSLFIQRKLDTAETKPGPPSFMSKCLQEILQIHQISTVL